MALDSVLAFELACGTAAVMGLWAACYLLSFYITIYDTKDKSVIQHPTLVQRFEAVDTLFALPFYLVIFALAFTASYELSGSVSSRWHGTSFSSWLFQLLYVVRMSSHCPIQWVVLSGNPTLRLQMTAHHLLSIVCYGGGLMTSRMHFWAALDGCCEFSTVFLNFVFAFKFFAPDKQDSFAGKASGLMLWVGFVIFRLVLFPVWLWLFFFDISNSPAESWDRVGMVERYFYAFVTIFLFVMSCMWFVPVTKGLLKALGMTAAKSKRTE